MLRQGPETPGASTRRTKGPARRAPTHQGQLTAVARASRPASSSGATLARRIVDGFLDDTWDAAGVAEIELERDDDGKARFDIYSLVAHHTRLLELPAPQTIDIQLRVLTVFAPLAHASLWVKRANARGRLICVAAAGVTGATRAVRRAAAEVLSGLESHPTRTRALVHALPVTVGGSVHAALVFRSAPGKQEAAGRYGAEAADALSHVLYRQTLIEGVETRDRLLEVLERRAARQRYELHDGTLQRMSTLISSLAHLHRQTSLLADRLAESEALALTADQELRELIRALPPTSSRSSLDSTIKRELRALKAKTGIAADLQSEGAPTTATAEQRRTAAGVVAEALANVRRHSGATRVTVRVVYAGDSLELTITDDGRGFSPAEARNAQRSGRFGLTAIRDRVRLAGGECVIESRTGGPTTVTAVIPNDRGDARTV